MKKGNCTNPYGWTNAMMEQILTDTCVANPKKAAEVLNWKAEKTLEDMCRDTWNWQTNNPMGYRK